jgi:hypothetical protein
LGLGATLAASCFHKGAIMAAKSKAKSKKKKASNVERLHTAGVIASEEFSEDDKKMVEKLSETEVVALISLRKKRGAAPEGKHHLRPNAFV